MSVNSDIVYFHSSLPPIHLSSSSSSLLIFPLPSPPLLFLLTCSPSSLLLFHSSYIWVKAIRWFLRRENFLFSPDEKEITKWKDQTIKEMIKQWKNEFLFSSNAEIIKEWNDQRIKMKNSQWQSSRFPFLHSNRNLMYAAWHDECVFMWLHVNASKLSSKEEINET